MRYMTFFSLVVMLAIPAKVQGGGNTNVKFAMHVIASSTSLGCDDLVPADCDSINVDVSEQELLAADGYGYVLFLAYDADSLSGCEFSVAGWPSSRGASPANRPVRAGS